MSLRMEITIHIFISYNLLKTDKTWSDLVYYRLIRIYMLSFVKKSTAYTLIKIFNQIYSIIFWHRKKFFTIIGLWREEIIEKP